MKNVETTKIRCRCKCHQGGLKHVSACCKNGYIEAPKKKVIEFDLPKGYSAEDAFYTALCHVWYIDNMYRTFYLMSNVNFISYDAFYEHFGINVGELDQEVAANLYLLLAAANGHKLE